VGGPEFEITNSATVAGFEFSKLRQLAASVNMNRTKQMAEPNYDYYVPAPVAAMVDALNLLLLGQPQ
jgi:hypothetical protein